MIDTPSARLAPDGELSVSASFFQNTQHYNLGFQILPWLETSFRYSGLSHFDPNYPIYYDRSFAVKARLWDEANIAPALAIGVNDIVGTGVYGGEYIVASKEIGNLDASIGLGFGRLGTSNNFANPLGAIFPSFKTRAPYSGQGGNFNFNQYFHGPSSGVFGGVIWHTPIDRLSVVAEYSSDDYAIEASRGNFRPASQVNYGIAYQATGNIALELNWIYGRSIGGNISIQLDPTRPQYAAKLNVLPPPVTVRTAEEQQQALQVMLMQTRGVLQPRHRAITTRNSFVDALWSQNGVKNAELIGRSLILTASGDTGRRCITAAQLAQSYGSGISAVVVQSTEGRKPVQCVTVAATEPAYQSLLVPEENLSAPTLHSDSEPVKTIDATDTDGNAVMRVIRANARNQRITIEALSLTDSIATVYFDNSHYFSESDALDRLTRILMKSAPPEIEKFRLIAVANGIPQQEFDILRGPEERKYTQTAKLDLFSEASGTTIVPPPLQNPALGLAQRQSYPRFSWDIFPQLREELFDPKNPFAVQLAAGVDGQIQIGPGLSLNSEVETSLFDNFNTGRDANSSLPHVRSDFLKYFSQGKTGIGDLDSEYRFRLAPTVFAVAKAGYLESMFAGGGGEVLWRPEGQRWALGADGYEVWQRGFDRLFDLQSYHNFTGHISLYYASPWSDLNFMASAGQYLAGDRGLTFQVTRRFSTGVEIGAFLTKTNISSAQFGEGSFDKGIIIRIPLDWALPLETQGQWGIDLRPIQRDGGQRLTGDATLYDETQRSSESEIRRDLEGFAQP